MRATATHSERETYPWLLNAQMQKVFQTGLSRLPSHHPYQGWASERVILCEEGAFSCSFLGQPCSWPALHYWRRLVALTGTHHVNQHRGAVYLQGDDEDLLDQLICCTISLHCRGAGEYFGKPVLCCEHHLETGLAVFRLCPDLAALERGELVTQSYEPPAKTERLKKRGKK